MSAITLTIFAFVYLDQCIAFVSQERFALLLLPVQVRAERSRILISITPKSSDLISEHCVFDDSHRSARPNRAGIERM